MLPCEFVKTRLHHGHFQRNVLNIFGVFICLVSQKIIVLIRLRQCNCLCTIGEILQLC